MRADIDKIAFMKIKSGYLSAWLVLAMVFPSVAEDDPFLDMLNNRGNDRDAILRELDKQWYKNAESLTVSPPVKDTREPPSPSFRQVAPTPVLGEKAIIQTAIAVILPTTAEGVFGTVARRFYEGCLGGLQAVNMQVRVDLYETDGTAAGALTAYAEAVADDSTLIIGPLQRKSVRAVLDKYPQAPVPTLLLQPGNGDGYYILTIDIGQEAAEFAALLAKEYRVLLVSDDSVVSRRQATAFADAWYNRLQPVEEMERFYVYNADKDWRRLFEKLKEDEDEKDEKMVDIIETVVFAAGGNDFIRNVRNFTPQRYKVYASGVLYKRAQTAGSQFLENLYVMEMPWFLDGENVVGEMQDPLIRSRPALQQRFFALGVDACSIGYQAVRWFDGWQFDGISGNITLSDDGVFIRRGVLVRYQGGEAQPVFP